MKVRKNHSYKYLVEEAKADLVEVQLHERVDAGAGVELLGEHPFDMLGKFVDAETTI